MKITERTHVLICKEITKTYLVRIGQIFCLYSVGGGKNLQNSTERMLHMGRQINHEGINNSMMGTETVEPVTRYDILEGQCGAANDKIIVPKEGEIDAKKVLLLLSQKVEDQTKFIDHLLTFAEQLLKEQHSL